MSSPTIDKELLTNLKLAKKRDPSKPLFFALMVKSPSEGALIVSKKKIPPKQIAEAKKEAGATVIVKGLCYGEGGDLIFETVKPPAPNWTALTKRLAKQDAGLTLVPVYRQGRDDEAVEESAVEDVEDADDEPAAGDSPAAKKEAADAAWKKRADGVTAAVKTAAGAGHPAVRDMALGVSEANTLYRSGQPEAAEKRLVAVEALLASDGKPTAPTGPSAPPVPGEATKRFNALTPALKAALQAKGPNLTRIQTLAGAVAGLLKNGDLVQAGRVIDELEPLLKPAPDAGGDPAAEWKAKLAEATPAIKSALAAKGPTAAEIGKLFAQASALSKPGGDMAQALKTLAECFALARESGATAPPPGPSAADPLKTEVMARLNAMAGGIKAGLAGPNAARVGALATAANGLIKNADYEQARKVLDELGELLKAAPKAGTDPAAEWKAKLAEYTPVIKAALTAKGPDAAEIGRLLAQATASSKPGGDPARALELLAEAHAKAKAATEPKKAPEEPEEVEGTEAKQQTEEVEGSEKEEQESEKEGGAETGDPALAAEYATVLKTLRPRLEKLRAQLSKTDAGAAAALGAKLDAAEAARGKGDDAVAYDRITVLDAEVNTLLRNVKAQAEVRKAAGPENVAFMVSKDQWNKARETARAELKKFQDAVLADPETRDDPRFDDEIVPGVKGMGAVLDAFDDRLTAALDEAAAVPAAEKGPAIRTALDLIAGYAAAVDTSQEIAAVDSGVYGAANVGGTLKAALTAMTERLTKRLKP